MEDRTCEAPLQSDSEPRPDAGVSRSRPSASRTGKSFTEAIGGPSETPSGSTSGRGDDWPYDPEVRRAAVKAVIDAARQAPDRRTTVKALRALYRHPLTPRLRLPLIEQSPRWRRPITEKEILGGP